MAVVSQAIVRVEGERGTGGKGMTESEEDEMCRKKMDFFCIPCIPLHPLSA